MNQVTKSKPKTSFSFYRNSSDKGQPKKILPVITLEQLEGETQTIREFIDERIQREDWRHEFMMKGNMACGVTSTGVDAVLHDEKRCLTPNEMFKEIFLRVKVLKQKMRIRFRVKGGKGVTTEGHVFEIGCLFLSIWK